MRKVIGLTIRKYINKQITDSQQSINNYARLYRKHELDAKVKELKFWQGMLVSLDEEIAVSCVNVKNNTIAEIRGMLDVMYGAENE